MSFTAEEVWMHIPDRPERSVFLSGLPRAREELMDPGLEERWARLMEIRDEVNKALELRRRERFIGNSLEARVSVHASGEDLKLLTDYAGFLPTLFIVSQAELRTDGEGGYRSEAVEGLSVTVERAEGRKCQRCWNWSTTVGSAREAPGICLRCRGNIA
jgi:isoleucyl-tRNA synthetase